MSRALSVGGQGSVPRVDDVVAVACNDVVVTLDSSNLNRIKKESPAPKAFVREEPGETVVTGDADRLANNVSRAGIYCALIRLVYGSSTCRPVVLQALEGFLREGGGDVSLPKARGDTDALAAIPGALAGHSTAVSLSDDAVSNAVPGGQAPGYSKVERLQLLSGSPITCGALAIATVQLRSALHANSVSLAMSCEALKASTAMFADSKLPNISASKYVADVSRDIVALLDGSSFVNAKPKDGGIGSTQPVVKAVPALGAALCAAQAAYDAVRSELAAPATPIPADWSSPIPSAAPLAPSAISLALSALAVATLCIARCLDVVGAAPEPLNEAAAAANTWLTTLRDRRNAVSARVSKSASDVGVLQAQAEPEEVPGVAAAEAAIAVADLLRECTACELALGAGALQHAIQPTAEASGGKGKKKPASLGKGAKFIISQCAADAASGATEDEGAPAADSTAAQPADFDMLKAAALTLLSPQRSAGLVSDLRRIIEANAARRKPKLPKGTRDFLPEEMAVRKRAFAIIEAAFERHGAVTIDTPVFELRETLAGKYGEDSKLIYDLADQGGELLSLRYDLTVPFARYVALNGIGNIKRYYIGKVYRRDNPQMNRGRFREFYQCDFDIAGSYPPMVPDAEVLRVLQEILTELNIGKFQVKLNHRALLDGIMAIAGVPPEKFRPICSAIDKLDKEPWPEVRREMVEDKGLPEASADAIGEYVGMKGAPREMLAQLLARAELCANTGAAVALAEMGELFGYLEAMDAIQSISFDMSLARGLDYYTGVIYEAVLVAGEGAAGVSVGSVAAGGRYDGLIGMYSGKDIPAVGVSIGVERVFTVLEARLRAEAEAASRKLRSTRTQVLVGAFGKGLQVERMKLCAELWGAGIRAEFGYKRDQNFNKDIIGSAQAEGIPVVVVFGDAELEAGTVNVKDMAAGTQQTVARAELLPALKELLQAVDDTAL